MASNRCIECTKDTTSVWEIFSEVDDWKKYTSKISDVGGFKIVYIHDTYIFKLIKPDGVPDAIRSGLLSEVTFPLYINKFGSDFLRLHTPRTIKLFRTMYNDKWGLGILEEKAKGMSLSAYIKKNVHINFKQAVDIACQGFEYINDLHQLHIPHLDIKPENIIFDPSNNQLTFIDFGLSCTSNCCKSGNSTFHEQCKGSFPGGTPGFICPGAFTTLKSTPEGRYSYDVYALTITIISIMRNGHLVRNNLGQSCHRVLKTGLPKHLEFYKENIEVSIKEFANSSETKNVKHDNFIKMLKLIILDNQGHLREMFPTAKQVLSKLNPNYCQALDISKTLALQETTIGFEKSEWDILEEEIVTPEEYAAARREEINASQPSLWNAYGYWK